MEVAVIITWIGMFFASVLNTPATTVVLVDNNSAKNAIVVETKAGSVIIDQPGGYVDISSSSKTSNEVKMMSEDEIKSRFKSAIESVPLKPVQVLLYFKSGSNELTQNSLALLPQILEDIKNRMPCDVNIIGHTDTQGSNQYNEKLSLERANYVKNWILSHNVDLNNIKVETYGERDLLIPTADNVAEEKNRRVELLIR